MVMICCVNDIYATSFSKRGFASDRTKNITHIVGTRNFSAPKSKRHTIETPKPSKEEKCFFSFSQLSRKITTNSAFIFTKQDGTVLQTITFERLDEILNGDYKTTDFTPATGLVYFEGAGAYPKGAVFSLSSLTPVTAYSTVDIAYKPENQWQGLLWYAYGTSLTAEGTGKYAKPLAEMAGLNLKNYGKGGSGIIPALHGSDSIKTRCMRLTDGKANADLITIEIIPKDGS
jgi:hypothetical protein